MATSRTKSPRKSSYEVIVGNVGTVYEGASRMVAHDTYVEYVNLSLRNFGRAAGESVTMLRDGEIVAEHASELDE